MRSICGLYKTQFVLDSKNHYYLLGNFHPLYVYQNKVPQFGIKWPSLLIVCNWLIQVRKNYLSEFSLKICET